MLFLVEIDYDSVLKSLNMYKKIMLSVYCSFFLRAICLKDQVGDNLAELLEIKGGLDAYGFSHDVFEKNPELWQILFNSAGFFKMTAEDFLDELHEVYSDSQIKRDAEIDTYKSFCDTIDLIETGGNY